MVNIAPEMPTPITIPKLRAVAMIPAVLSMKARLIMVGIMRVVTNIPARRMRITAAITAIGIARSLNAVVNAELISRNRPLTWNI